MKHNLKAGDRVRLKNLTTGYIYTITFYEDFISTVKGKHGDMNVFTSYLIPVDEAHESFLRSVDGADDGVSILPESDTDLGS